MLKIRLTRSGSKKRPYYHMVVADVRSPRDGRFIEKVGSYNPLLEQSNGSRIVLKTERIQHWLSVGALPTDRVAKFLADAGLAKGQKRPEQTKQHLPKTKAQERMKELEEKKAAAEAAAAEAAKAPEPEPVAEVVEEAPAPEAVEETPVAETVEQAPVTEETSPVAEEAAPEAEAS